MHKNMTSAAGFQDSEFSFPFKIYDLLEEASNVAGFESIISWSKDGKSFKVHDREKLVKIIIPRHFEQTRYKSFVRQLSSYQFKRIRKGPTKGKKPAAGDMFSSIVV